MLAISRVRAYVYKRLGILIVIVLLVLSSWALVALFRRLRRQRATRGWWVAFGVLIGCGLALGIWCAFYSDYHVGSHFRLVSFPIPVVFFHFEQGDWVDFPVPELQGWVTMFTNVITITALATLPLWLVSWRQHNHESTHRAA